MLELDEISKESLAEDTIVEPHGGMSTQKSCTVFC
ncbi:hypothetical protein DES38_11720 [Streptohalobacillus salinus]|uniref:Uncharacterized protein n=1 Tax=Streptohalobacillus salinus TaxID=621096 RepID=A0A2V3VZH0_9BACI|nr:hypothetical protein DES38_11720 [Streptohalobacillus salinus]